MIKRAENGQKMAQNYSFRYLDFILKQNEISLSRSQIEQWRVPFQGYTNALIQFVESKYSSYSPNVGVMATQLSNFEKQIRASVADQKARHEFQTMWQLIYKLDQAFPQAKRPSNIQVLKSVADVKSPNQIQQRGAAKDPHQVKLAKISCQQLEESFLEEVCESHQQMITGDMNVQIAFLDSHIKIDAFALKAKETVDLFSENNPDQSNTLLQVLIEDNQTSTFPFFVVLLLFRAGCHNEALQFCETS